MTSLVMFLNTFKSAPPPTFLLYHPQQIQCRISLGLSVACQMLLNYQRLKRLLLPTLLQMQILVLFRYSLVNTVLVVSCRKTGLCVKPLWPRHVYL